MSAAIAGLVESQGAPEALLVAATYDGRDVAARLSARIDRPVLTNVVGLESDGDSIVSEHAIFGGAQVLKARFTGRVQASSSSGPSRSLQSPPGARLQRSSPSISPPPVPPTPPRS